MLKQGSMAKTTFGKLRRVETHRVSVVGSWTAAEILKSIGTEACSDRDPDIVTDAAKTIRSVLGLVNGAA